MRSADAAKNTAVLIEDTVNKVTDGSEIVAATNEAFVKVSESAGKVGQLVAEISEASNEQANGIEQVNLAITEMDKVVQQNAANAEESASASEEMNAQAEQLKDYVGDLSHLVSGKRNKTASAGRKRTIKPVSHHLKTVGSGKKKMLSHDTKEIRSDQVIPFDRARKIIDTLLKDTPVDADEKMDDLGRIISGLSSAISVLKKSEPVPDTVEPEPSDPAPEPELTQAPYDPEQDGHELDGPDISGIKPVLENLSNLIAGFCPGDIPELGVMLNSFDELIDMSTGNEFTAFHDVCIACKGYVEYMTLENIHNTKPLEEGLVDKIQIL